jgi:hypothetical protein
MKLEDWLKKKDISINRFARMVGCSPACVHHWLRKGTVPILRHRQKISMITLRQVSWSDLGVDRVYTKREE